MTADQVRSLQAASAALWESFRPYLRAGLESRAPARACVGFAGGPEAEEH